MNKYLLDTNIVIFLFRQKYQIQEKIDRAINYLYLLKMDQNKNIENLIIDVIIKATTPTT